MPTQNEDVFLQKLLIHHSNRKTVEQYVAVETFSKSISANKWAELKGDLPSSPQAEKAVFDILQIFADRFGSNIDRAAFGRLVLSGRVILDSHRFKVIDRMNELALAYRDPLVIDAVKADLGNMSYKLRVLFLVMARKIGDRDIEQRIRHWAMLNRKFTNFEALKFKTSVRPVF